MDFKMYYGYIQNYMEIFAHAAALYLLIFNFVIYSYSYTHSIAIATCGAVPGRAVHPK